MVNDLQSLKARCDLRVLVEHDLGPAPKRGGRAHLWKCPFHHEQRGYSLAVWADGYRCFGACNRSGDLFDWLQRYRRLSFAEALEVIGQELPVHPIGRARLHYASSEPPPGEWQEAARQVVDYAEDQLWSLRGQAALSYLLGRGLTSQTIRKARLGLIPGDWRSWQTLHGLSVPAGILIPWFAGGALWAVKVRRGAGDVKYVQIAGGCAHALYNADSLEDRSAALLCEGEFDALIAEQEAGKLVAVVSLGSASSLLNLRWYSHLITCSSVLVAYDNDEAGEKGARQVCKVSPRFRQIHVPEGNDITDYYLADGDIYQWIEHELYDGLLAV
ncbi:MAG: toprim domain-containing protein [Anaerolinea sp.]|nr:toprim domain-containing protein [Anaerolinea sp.]